MENKENKKEIIISPAPNNIDLEEIFNKTSSEEEIEKIIEIINKNKDKLLR